MTNEEHLRKLHNSLRAPYGTWKCSHCSFIGESRAKLKEHRHKEHPQFCIEGGWNKGLTKETNESIRKYSETIKEKIANGEIIPPWTGRKHTIEEKQHLSLVQSNNAATGKIMGHRQDVAFYHCKNINNEDFLLRGTWELNVAKQLNTKNILWTRDKKIEYQDLNGCNHTYTPDFYLPATDEYIEVKGLFPEADKIKNEFNKRTASRKKNLFHL